MSSVSANPMIKSDREREREAVNTVKAWVADWEKRKRSLHDAALLVLRSIDRGSENTTKEFAVVS
jgi:DNA-binding transcriptional regulator YiaG